MHIALSMIIFVFKLFGGRRRGLRFVIWCGLLLRKRFVHDSFRLVGLFTQYVDLIQGGIQIAPWTLTSPASMGLISITWSPFALMTYEARVHVRPLREAIKSEFGPRASSYQALVILRRAPASTISLILAELASRLPSGWRLGRLRLLRALALLHGSELR